MATFLNPKLWKKNEAYQIGEIVISEGEIWQSCLAVPAGKDLDAPYWAKVYAEESGGSTQTLTVTKSDTSDTVLVDTISWADYIAGNYDAAVEVHPDSTEDLVSVYSIPVGTAFIATINNEPVKIYLEAEMTRNVPMIAMPSTPLYVANIK